MAVNNVFQMLAQQEMERPERDLKRLQLKTLMDEAKYKEQSRLALSAPQPANTSLQTLGSMGPEQAPFNPVAGPQMASIDPNAQGGTLSALGVNPMQRQEVKPPSLLDGFQRQYNYHKQQGREDYAQKVLQDQMEFTLKVADFADKIHKQQGAEGVAAWMKANPEISSVLGDMSTIKTHKNGIWYPVTKNESNEVIPGKYWSYDGKGGIQMHEDKPREVQTFAPGVGIQTGVDAQGKPVYDIPVPATAKPEYKSRERKDGRQIFFEESHDNGKTWKQVGQPSPIDKPPSAGGQEPVAQTTFVDAETGKPLVFDKKTGTYRIANVEGGVAPKPGAMSPEQATRAQQFETVITNIPKIREMVLDKKGNIISKLDIANSQVGTWGTKGRQIRQEVKRTVEQALRIATGAAAPDSEVANYTDMYAPQVGDTKEQIAEKFKALETFAEGTRAKFNVGRSPQAINQGQGRAAPAKRKAPMVTKGGFKVTVVP